MHTRVSKVCAMAISIHLHVILVLLLPLLTLADETHNISLGTSLVASDKSSPWQSPSGEFAFGFRRIQKDVYLLAVWFNNIADKTVIWYANGDSPAPQGSKIELTADGHFKLTGPKGEEIWPKSNLDGVAYAAMLDTGNFVLASSDSSFAWESFKYPTNTILPTQVLGLGGKLFSQQTENNYSKGRFQLRLQTDGDLLLNPIALPTEFAYRSYFRTNTSDPADEMNSGYQLVLNESGYLNVVLRNGRVVTLTNKTAVPSTGEYYYRATLDSDGIFTQYAHPKTQTNGTWFPLWLVPDNICSDVNGDQGDGPCGFNSYCRLDVNKRPICDCLPGFSLWDANNKFSGCKQDTPQSCDQQSGSKPEDLYVMKEVPNAYWPGSANFAELESLSEDDCSTSCLYDCNCVVAVIIKGSCHKKKLPLTNGRQDYYFDGKALIKVPKSNSLLHPPCESSNVAKKDQATLILAGALLLGSSVFLNFLLLGAISIVTFFSYQKRHKLIGSSSILESNLRRFTFKELKESTDEFREELGRGAFGIVYRGVISSSTSRIYVAVKKLDRLLQEGEKEFKTEVTVIAQTHHKNLVKLIGFCDEGPNKLLVYEFMSNGTLASFIFGISRPDWNKRIQLAFDIARGLTYLHEECCTQIIHCDIKPHNILLDDSFTAKISDFGLAKLLMNDQTRTLTAIRGTRGYVAPEWFRNMPITAKVDVYSYGVMLLEILFCRKSLEMERENEEEVILTDWVYDCYKERKLGKLVEDDEEARSDMKKMERLVMVAIWCIQEDPSLRPSMRMVTQMLEGIVQVSVPPSPTPFTSIV